MQKTAFNCIVPAQGEGISKEGGLQLHATAGGVGEHKTSTETEGKAGGFKAVSARRYVVHEMGLPKNQSFSGAGKVVLLWRDRAHWDCTCWVR